MIIKEVQFGSKEYLALCELREQELRIPLGLRLIPEDVKGEDKQFHFGIFKDDQAIACTILAPLNGRSIKMRQVCTSSKFQGRGCGRDLLHFAEDWARKRNYQEINCHARETACAFYLKHAYQIEGELFNEIGIPHYFMKKSLV